jgi:hypothetical protein
MERFIENTESQLNLLEIKITAEGHIAQVNNALSAIQRNLDLMIESVINAQKGNIAATNSCTQFDYRGIKMECFSFPEGNCHHLLLARIQPI